MALPLLKPIHRELASTSRKGRKIILTIEPGDMITFREKGKRTEVSVYAGHAYMLAQIMSEESHYKKKVEEYNKKKKLGYKGLRKPRKAQFPYNKIYFKALTQ